MVQLKRDAAIRLTGITALIVTLGALTGAVTSIVVFLLLAAASGPVPRPDTAAFWIRAATLGAAAGAAIGTPIALLFLRRVAVGRATLETAGAAGLGVAAGTVIPVAYAWIYGAVLFAALAAVRLRITHRATGAPAVRPGQDG